VKNEIDTEGGDENRIDEEVYHHPFIELKLACAVLCFCCFVSLG
jgi:hypothetical protein